MTRRKKIIPSTQKHLSQDAIEQYLFGKEKETVRHRTERQLLEDIFSAEAVEGLSTQAGARQMTANMNDLKARLQQRIAQQKQKRGATIMPFGMQPYAIAASVALLLACAIVVLFSTRYFEKTKETAPLAQKAEPQKPVAATPQTTDSEAVSSKEIQPSADVTANAAETKTYAEAEADKQPVTGNAPTAPAYKIARLPDRQVSPEKAKSAPPVAGIIQPETSAVALADEANTSAKPKEAPVMMEEKMAALPSTSALDTQARSESFDKKKDANSVATAKSTIATRSKETNDVQPAQVVKGRVVDAEDGLAIPGTVVTVKGTTISAYTNQNGEYTISVPEGGELSFNFIGYVSYRIPVEDKRIINARLSPDVKSLSEVVITGTEEKNGTAYQPAQPESGMPEFMKAVEQKLETSANADYAGSGTIKISFTVQPDGSLANVKVLKSLCPTCDQAAVQAVTEASRWKPAQENGKPVSQKMKIRIPFRSRQKDK